MVTWSPHIALRHPAAAILLALFLFSLVHSELLEIFLKIWIFIIQHTLSPSQVHVSLPLVSSFKSLLTVYARTGPKPCATLSGSPSGWPHSLGTVFPWPAAHPLYCHPDYALHWTLMSISIDVHLHWCPRTSWGNFLDILLKSRYTSCAIFPEEKVHLTWLLLNPYWPLLIFASFSKF